MKALYRARKEAFERDELAVVQVAEWKKMNDECDFGKMYVVTILDMIY